MRNGPYELVLAPADYPGKKYRERYVYEHQLVWWQQTGSLVPKGHVLHHKDENKRHNAFNNLELKTAGHHAGEHSKQRAHGPVTLVCRQCSRMFKKEWRNYNFAFQQGRTSFYCSRQCQWAGQVKNAL